MSLSGGIAWEREYGCISNAKFYASADDMPWRIEVLNADGTHHSYVPRFGNGDISAERALACLNETLDHARFSVRVVYT